MINFMNFEIHDTRPLETFVIDSQVKVLLTLTVLVIITNVKIAIW